MALNKAQYTHLKCDQDSGKKSVAKTTVHGSTDTSTRKNNRSRTTKGPLGCSDATKKCSQTTFKARDNTSGHQRSTNSHRDVCRWIRCAAVRELKTPFPTSHPMYLLLSKIRFQDLLGWLDDTEAYTSSIGLHIPELPLIQSDRIKELTIFDGPWKMQSNTMWRELNVIARMVGDRLIYDLVHEIQYSFRELFFSSAGRVDVLDHVVTEGMVLDIVSAAADQIRMRFSGCIKHHNKKVTPFVSLFTIQRKMKEISERKLSVVASQLPFDEQ